MKTISLQIQGEVPSKKNSYQRGKQGRFYIKQNVRDLMDDLHLQLNTCMSKPRSPITAPVRVEITVWDSKGLRDVDNQSTTLLDLLQKSGYIKNDKQVKELSVKRGYSASFPYVDIMIVPHEAP